MNDTSHLCGHTRAQRHILAFIYIPSDLALSRIKFIAYRISQVLVFITSAGGRLAFSAWETGGVKSIIHFPFLA
jgi:hypothetical protein